MPNYLNKVVYLTDAQYATLCANHNTTIGGHKYDANTLYITNTPGNASTVNGYTVEKDVPFDAVFTDTNKYHESGSWNGLTYTATSIGGAGTLDFTIPTGTSNTTVAAGNHEHGNITNDGKIGSNANKVAVTTTGGLLTTASTMYASDTKLAINSSSAPTENLYVYGTIQFNLGTSNTSSNYRKFIIQGANSAKMSIAPTGIQVYNSSNAVTTMYLQAQGGSLIIGSSDYSTATRDMYGVFDFKSSTGFNYSGIGAGSDNAARNIWFSYNGKRGVPVYDDDFKYNPSTNTLSIGTGTLTATNYSGTSATVTTTDDTTNTMYLVGVKSGATTTLLYDTNLTINNTTIAANNALYLKTTASNSLIFQRGDTYVGAFNTSSNLVLGIGDSATWNTVTSFKLYVNGKTLLNNSTASSTDGLSSQLIVRNNASSPGNVAIELVRGSQVNTTYTSWQIAVESGDLHLRSNYNADGSGLNTAYTYDAFSLVRNTGSATFKGSVTATTYYGALECRASTSNLARHVWFSYSTNGTTEDEGVLGKDDDFKYNPNTNVLTIGKLTITGGTTNSTIASSGTLDIANAAKALTISTTTAALTISTGNGALEAKSTGTGTVKLTSNSGAMTLSTTSGNMSLSSGGTIDISSGSSKALSITSGSTMSLDSGTSMSISSGSGKTTAINSGSTMYLQRTSGASIVFCGGGTAIANCHGRFNPSGNFQLETGANTAGTQNTHKLYVKGDSAFEGKIAFATAASDVITNKAYMQWNETDQSLDFIFA